MLKQRIKKYSHILNAVLHQKGELDKLEEDQLSKLVKKAFLHVKKEKYEEFDEEKLAELALFKSDLIANHESISYEFFGIDDEKSVSEIAKNASSPKKWCHFFYFLTQFSEAEKVLEIGTNLGISGQYFLSAIPTKESSLFVTMEGHPKLCAIASKRFENLPGETKFEVVQGMYGSTMPKVVASDRKFDVVFFDGNHKYQPTLDYFNNLKNNYSKDVILIFDDIHWNDEMKKAWEQLKKEPGVYCSIDFYKLGIVLYNKNKQHLQKKDCNLFLTF